MFSKQILGYLKPYSFFMEKSESKENRYYVLPVLGKLSVCTSLRHMEE